MAATPEPTTWPGPGYRDRRLWLAVFIVVAAIAIAVIRPFRVFAVGFDTTAAIVYWDRLAAGQRLEAFLGTTPKPLLSILDGPLYGITHDWRAIGLLAIAVYAAGIASATILVRRLAGTYAAIFVAVGFVASWQLFQDVSVAYAESWLVLTVAVAGLLATAARPRYGWAGVVLMAGALARQEVLFVTALGLCLVAGRAIFAKRAEGPALSRRPWLLAVGLLAIPLTAVHDWLLTGDPGYSLQVQAIGADGRATRGLASTISFVVHHFQPSWPLVVLALIGLILAVRRGQWTIVAGLVALGPLVVGLVLFVGWRRYLVLERYLVPADLALVVGAAIAVSTLARAIEPVASIRGPAIARLTAIGFAGFLALALSSRVGPLDAALHARLDLERRAMADLGTFAPAMERFLATVPGVRDRPVVAHPLTRPNDRAVLVVPGRLLPTIVAQLGLPLDRIAFLRPELLGNDGPAAGTTWLVYHQRGLTIPESDYAALEATAPGGIGPLAIEPVQAIDRQAWLLTLRRLP